MQTIRTIDQGRLYMFWAEGSVFIKIGFTRYSVDRRALQIQTGCPLPLRILGERVGTEREERQIHRQLASFRTTGEWFALPEVVVWRLLSYFGQDVPAEYLEAKH